MSDMDSLTGLESQTGLEEQKTGKLLAKGPETQG